MADPQPRWAHLLVVALLALFAARVIHHSTRIAPTFDEPAHLVGGYTNLRWHDYRVNPEHPPLVKKLAALPLLVFDPVPEAFDFMDPEPYPGPGSLSGQWLKELWFQTARESQYQWRFAHEMLYGVKDSVLERVGARGTMMIDPLERIEPEEFLNSADRLFFWGRMPVLVFGLLLCMLVYTWARELFGWIAGLVALTFCAFDPNIVAHSTLVTTDVAAATLIFGTIYGLWRFQREGRWPAAALAVTFLALAFTAKFSAILLAPLVALLVVVSALWLHRQDDRRRAVQMLLILVVCGVAALMAVWGIYEFRYSGMAADQAAIPMPVEERFRRVVEQEAAFDPSVEGREYLGLVDRLATFANRHHLLPESYLYGLAYARAESRARPAFLRGEFSKRGFRSFFIWTFLLKTPLLSLLAIAGALVLVVPRQRWIDGLFLLLPVLVFFGSALGSHLNIGHRHILPIYPFLFVLAGALAAQLSRHWSDKPPFRLALAMALVALSSTVVFWPVWRPTGIAGRPLEFFNELAGGPQSGFRSLVDSNLDWGQSLAELGQWLEDEEITEPINLCYFGTADPRFYQIQHVRMPCEYMFSPPFNPGEPFRPAIVPGLLAISVTHLQGERDPESMRSDRWRVLRERAEFVDSIGYSMLILKLNKTQDPESE